MKKCPLIKKACMESDCMWWVQMMKRNIATQELAPAHDCAINKLPELLVEQLRNTTGIQEAVESSRNENVKRQDKLLGIFDLARRAQIANTG